MCNDTTVIVSIIVVIILLILFVKNAPSVGAMKEGLLSADESVVAMSDKDAANQLSRGVTTSIMERRGDQTAFGRVASRQKSKNSQFEQTISQAALFGES